MGKTARRHFTPPLEKKTATRMSQGIHLNEVNVEGNLVDETYNRTPFSDILILGKRCGLGKLHFIV